MTLAASGDKFVMIHDIDLMISQAVRLGDRVSYLLPDADVPLSDEDTGVVDRLGEPKLEHLQINNNMTYILITRLCACVLHWSIFAHGK